MGCSGEASATQAGDDSVGSLHKAQRVPCQVDQIACGERFDMSNGALRELGGAIRNAGSLGVYDSRFDDAKARSDHPRDSHPGLTVLSGARSSMAADPIDLVQI